jgi:hypothetical protein
MSGGRDLFVPKRRSPPTIKRWATKRRSHVRLVLADTQPPYTPPPPSCAYLPQDMSNKGRDAALASELWLAADELVAKALARGR